MASPMDIDHPPPAQSAQAARPQRSSLALGAQRLNVPDEAQAQQQQQQPVVHQDQRPTYPHSQQRRYSQEHEEQFQMRGQGSHYSSSSSQQAVYRQHHYYHQQDPSQYRHHSSHETARASDRQPYEQLQPPADIDIRHGEEQEYGNEYGHPSSSSSLVPPGPASAPRRRQRHTDHPLSLSSSSSSLRLGSSSISHRAPYRQRPFSPGSADATTAPNDPFSPGSEREGGPFSSALASPTTTTSPSSPQRPYHHHPYYHHASQTRRFEHDSRQATGPPSHLHSRFFPAAPVPSSQRPQSQFQHVVATSSTSSSAAASPSTFRQQPEPAMTDEMVSPPEQLTKDASCPESPQETYEMDQEPLEPTGSSTSNAAGKRRLGDELINGSIGPIRANVSGAGSSFAAAAAAKRKSKILNSDRKRICEYHRDNPGHRQDDIAALFGIERSTVSRILKDQDRWLAIEDASEAAKIAKHRTGRFPTLEARLSEWADTLIERDEAVSDSDLKAQALKFAAELGLEGSFRASLGWCEKFREKKGLRKAFGGPAFPLAPSLTAAIAAAGGAVAGSSSATAGAPADTSLESNETGRDEGEEDNQLEEAEGADQGGVPAREDQPDARQQQREVRSAVGAKEKPGSPPSRSESSSNSSYLPNMLSGSLSFSGIETAGETTHSASGFSRADTGSGATGFTTTASSSSSSVGGAALPKQSRKKMAPMSPLDMQNVSPVVPSSATAHGGGNTTGSGSGAGGRTSGRAAFPQLQHSRSSFRIDPDGSKSAGSGGSVSASTPTTNSNSASNSAGPSPLTGSVPSPPLVPSRLGYGGPPGGGYGMPSSSETGQHVSSLPLPPSSQPSHGSATVGLGLGLGGASGSTSGGDRYLSHQQAHSGSYQHSRQHGIPPPLPSHSLPPPTSSSFAYAPQPSSPARHQTQHSQAPHQQSHPHSYWSQHGGYGMPPPATANLPDSASSHNHHHQHSHPHQLPPLSSSSAARHHVNNSSNHHHHHHPPYEHPLHAAHGEPSRHLPRPHTSHHSNSHALRSHPFHNEGPRLSGVGGGVGSGGPFAYSTYRDPHQLPTGSYYSNSRQPHHEQQSPSPPPMLPLPHRYRQGSISVGLGPAPGLEGGSRIDPTRAGPPGRGRGDENEDVFNDEDEDEMYRSSLRRPYRSDGPYPPSRLTQRHEDIDMGGESEEISRRQRGYADGVTENDSMDNHDGGYTGRERHVQDQVHMRDAPRSWGRREYEARPDQVMSSVNGGSDGAERGRSASPLSPRQPMPTSSPARIINGSSRHGQQQHPDMYHGQDAPRYAHRGSSQAVRGQPDYDDRRHRRSSDRMRGSFSEHGESDSDDDDELDEVDEPRAVSRHPNGNGSRAPNRIAALTAAAFSPINSPPEPSTPPPPTAATSAALSAINGLPGHHPNGVNGTLVNGTAAAAAAGTNGPVTPGAGGLPTAAASGAPAPPIFGQVMLANEGGDVSIQQARDALDLVLRFLQDQSEEFCPRTHYVTIGNLQGTLAAAAFARAQIRLQQEQREAAEQGQGNQSQQQRPGTAASTSTATSLTAAISALAPVSLAASGTAEGATLVSNSGHVVERSVTAAVETVATVPVENVVGMGEERQADASGPQPDAHPEPRPGPNTTSVPDETDQMGE